MVSEFLILNSATFRSHLLHLHLYYTAEGEEKSGADCQVKIKLIAPPMYVMTCMTLDKELGLETMNHCIEVIATTIRAKGYVHDVLWAVFVCMCLCASLV